MTVYDKIVPIFVLRFSDQNADVRKSVVFFLVECMVKLGKDMDKYTESLVTSQRKLLDVYLSK